jgi:hypothetical protein
MDLRTLWSRESGGSTFRRGARFSVDLYDKESGIITGLNSTALRLQNKQAWAPIQGFPSMVIPLMQIPFSDDQHGWIVWLRRDSLHGGWRQTLALLHRPRMNGRQTRKHAEDEALYAFVGDVGCVTCGLESCAGSKRTPNAF